jgi:hypothetical protein
MWGALSDESTGMSFRIAAGLTSALSGPNPATHDHIYIVSDSRLPQPEGPAPPTPRTGWSSYTPRYWVPFLLPPTTCRAMVEVFEPASMSVTISQCTIDSLRSLSINCTEITTSNSSSIVFVGCFAMALVLLFTQLLPSNVYFSGFTIFVLSKYTTVLPPSDCSSQVAYRRVTIHSVYEDKTSGSGQYSHSTILQIISSLFFCLGRG